MTASVDWKLVETKLMLSQDPETRKLRKAAFKKMDPSGNGKLSLTEVQGAILGYLDDDSCRAAGEKNKYLVPLRDFKGPIKKCFTIARDLAPTRKSRSQRRGQTDTNIDKNEFHPFLIAFRQYLEMALVFEQLDGSGDGKLCFVEAEKGKALFESWDITISDVRKLFPSDKYAEEVDYTHFADWLVKKRVGDLNLALDDSDAEEVVKEQAAHDVRAAEEMSFGDGKLGRDLEMAQNQRKVTEAFSKWDSDHSGGITEAEMAEVLMTLNPNFSKEDVTKVFKAADKNQDSVIDYSEFVAWLFKAGQ
eukprot:TRINITY_DN72292_c0_g1_i1.p1 TRINITY_DN72292_c0_g1~~TRINITY_DN72292_c0_g1_i1.p1  ORF type:complete len:305 (-),score=74.11 TRINITY_DN72292_c0_g1_i1:163-1077(-)